MLTRGERLRIATIGWLHITFVLVSCGGSGPTAPTPRDVITFLGSSPPPGSTVTVEGCDGRCTESLITHFSVVYTSELPFVALRVELMDDMGRVCASGTAGHPAPYHAAGEPFTLVVDYLLYHYETCPFPATVSSMWTTLRGNQNVFQAPRNEEYLKQQFPIAYTFVARTPSPSATAPEIVNLTVDTPGIGDDPPRPGGFARLYCGVEDKDGDGVTLTFTLQNGGGGWLESADGSRGANLSLTYPPWPYGRTFEVTFQTVTETVATVTCGASDSRGLQAIPRSVTLWVTTARF